MPAEPAAGGLPASRRLPLLALGMLSLLAALWSGLVRLPWALPAPHAGWAALHGPLMIAGFLGTVIGLERAVGLRRTWAYAGPLATGLGALALIAGLDPTIGATLVTAGSAVLVAASLVVTSRQPAWFTVTMAAGALAWLGGNVLWLAGWPLFRVVLWWAGFLVLTIVGERLELSRMLRPTRFGRAAFVAAAALFVLGLLLVPLRLEAGTRLAGAGLLALAAWLARYDIARRTVRQTGLTRFVAVCLLSGYAWLALAGLHGLLAAPAYGGPAYDAFLHMVFLGFVFTMIFGHAPIIFPAVLQRPLRYAPRFYGHVALLHAALLVRVVGDLGGWPALRAWGGAGNVAAVLWFLGNTVAAILAARRERAGE